MKGGRIPSEDLKGLKQKKHNAMPIANETKCCAGHQKKHKAMTTAKEMKQSDLSEQADDTGPFPPDESTLSGLRDSTSSLFGNSDLDDASDDDSEEASHGDDEHIVYADFEFFDPKPDDFHGVRNLLKTYCDGKEWDLNGFVDIILAQTTVGSIIKTDGDSLFGVITALNLARYKLSSWSFTFPTNAEYLATHELKDLRPMRLLMAVKVEKMQTFRTQLKALLDES